MITTKRILGIMLILVLLIASGVPFLVNTEAAAAQGEDLYVVDRFLDENGKEIEVVIYPVKPPEIEMESVALPEPDAAGTINTISGVPAFNWCYGCSATSAAMLFGYYDRNGYPNMYAGSTNGGVCPLDNSSWGTTYYPDTCGSGAVTCGECPLSATHLGYDGLTTKGHVDDYWLAYACTGDPYYGNWTEHGYADCTADYMGTSQYYNWGDTDGSTLFYNYSNGAVLCDYSACEPGDRDGAHGMKLFAESRGYTVVANCNQYIYGYGGNTQGFTYAQFQAEIDAGRPVIIQLIGHSMLGIGYDTSTNKVYFHSTWDWNTHEMTWGGSYGGMVHRGVTYFQLAAAGTPPTVETWAAASVADTSARLKGNLSSLGGATAASCYFEWGLTTSYGNTTLSQSMTSTGVFKQDISGLSVGTTYHYRSVGVGGSGTDYGPDKTFTTTGGTTPPTMQTWAAQSVTDSSATLRGYLDDLGSASSVDCSFEYGTTTSYGSSTCPTTETATGVFKTTVSLSPGTTYHYRSIGAGDGTSYGPDKTFTTDSVPPTMETWAATNLTATSARLKGNLADMGSATSVDCYFEWGTTTSYGNTTYPQALTATGVFKRTITGLSPSTTYHYRSVGIGSTAYGPDKTFTTIGGVQPTMQTWKPNPVYQLSAKLRGYLADMGTASSVNCYFEWGTTTSYGNTTSTSIMTGIGTFNRFLSGLSAGTTYHYRSVGDGHGTDYGPDKYFTTNGGTAPTAETWQPQSVTTTSAKLRGNLASLGSATTVEVYFEWGTTTSYGNTTSSQDMTATGVFKQTITGLSAGTTYHYRSVAVGSGTSYGPDKTFSTNLP